MESKFPAGSQRKRNSLVCCLPWIYSQIIGNYSQREQFLYFTNTLYIVNISAHSCRLNFGHSRKSKYLYLWVKRRFWKWDCRSLKAWEAEERSRYTRIRKWMGLKQIIGQHNYSWLTVRVQFSKLFTLYMRGLISNVPQLLAYILVISISRSLHFEFLPNSLAKMFLSDEGITSII